MSNFWLRTITGICFLVVLIGAIWIHPMAFGAVFLLVVIAGIFELKRLTESTPVKMQILTALILSVWLFVVSFAIHYWALPQKYLLLLIPAGVSVFVTELYRKKDRPFWNIALTFLPVIYVALPFVCLLNFAFLNGEYQAGLVLTFFGMVWINDTGAYVVGVLFGRHRLFERISPKKSWEGFWGGMAFSLILAGTLSCFTQRISLIDLLIMALIVSIMGTLGDLSESMLKRSMGIKDSGTILPGHGGVLDRFDAVILSIPLVYAYFEFLN